MKFPLKIRTWSSNKTLIVLIIVSIVVFLISLHKIAVSGFEGDSVYGYKACKTRRYIIKEIIYLYVALNTWLPTILIVALNAQIYNEIRKNRKRREQLVQNTMSKSDEKATKLLMIVSSTYVLLILPLGIVQTSELIWNGTMAVSPGHSDYIHFMTIKIRLKWTRAFFFFFYQFNFAINFFLYVASSSATRFRANLRRVLRMKQKPEESMFTKATKTNAVAPAEMSSHITDTQGDGQPSNNRKVEFANRNSPDEGTSSLI